MNSLAGHPVLLDLKAKLHKEAERPCYPKRRYDTREEAQQALDRLKVKFGHESDEGNPAHPLKPFFHLNTYRCRFCEGYHLGNTAKPGAVPLPGNSGTVSFEEMPIGQREPSPPKPQSRKERRRTRPTALPAIRRGKP